MDASWTLALGVHIEVHVPHGILQGSIASGQRMPEQQLHFPQYVVVGDA